MPVHKLGNWLIVYCSAQKPTFISPYHTQGRWLSYLSHSRYVPFQRNVKVDYNYSAMMHSTSWKPQQLWWWSDVMVSALASINEVNQHSARLVLGWVTVSEFNSQSRTFISVCKQPPRSTQPGHSFVGRHNEYQPQAVMPCGWGVKTGMVRVWVAGKTVWSPCYTLPISECLTSGASHNKALYKSSDYYYSYSTCEIKNKNKK